MEISAHIKELAEKFYYLMDAAGGQSSMNAQSSPAEINDYLGASKEDFDKALDFLVKKGIVKVDGKGTTIISSWAEKVCSCKK